jgi:transposase
MVEVSGRWFIDQEEPESGDLVATIPVTRRFDLTDGQWAVLAPLLPQPKRSGRPSLWSKRQLIDGIRWRIRVGAPWRDVPAHYGSWQAAYALFRRWQRDGTWQRVLTALQALADAQGQITWDVSVAHSVHGASWRSVAQDQDLHVFGCTALGEQGEPFGEAAEHEVEHA